MNKERRDELMEAIQRVNQARQNFELAEPDYVEAAVEELTAAELALNAVIKKAKVA